MSEASAAFLSQSKLDDQQSRKLPNPPHVLSARCVSSIGKTNSGCCPAAWRRVASCRFVSCRGGAGRGGHGVSE